MRVFTLSSGVLEAHILDHGATLKSLRAPDRHGSMAEVVLGFDDAERYRGPHPYLGGIVGRYANRIARGRFELEGRPWRLSCNSGGHHLHGGVHGFDRVQWDAEQHDSAVELRYVSCDGEEGYPGTLEVRVRYSVHENALSIEYQATTDAPTVLNLTNHAYFNLAGAGTIDRHCLRIDAERYVEVDADLIPTGELRALAGTPMDFTEARALGTSRLDHTYVLRGGVELAEPVSGRVLRIATTQPGIQAYTGHLLDGSLAGRGGARYVPRAGVCLEPQHFPDSPNRPAFPSTTLYPGQRYRQQATYAFSISA